MDNFSVIHRNYGHWDIVKSDEGRVFRVRGGPGKYVVIDERNSLERAENITLKTVSACMTYICDELMFELITVKGQVSHEIEGWNI